VGALGVLTCLSAVFGLSLGGSATFFLRAYGRELLFFGALVVAIRNVRDLRLMLLAYVASMAITVVLSFTAMETAATMTGLQRISGNESPYDANDLGVLFMVGIPLSLIIFTSARGLTKWLAAFVLVGIPAAVALTGSRGALLGLAAVGTMLFLTVRQLSWSKKIFFAVSVITALALTAPAGYWDQMRSLLNPTSDYNFTDESGRKATAMRGVGYALQYPLFGVGLANFGRAEATISPLLRTNAPGDRILVNAAHNTYIEVAAELGLPALVIWCTLLFGTVFSLRRLARRLPSSWARGTEEERLLYGASVYIPISLVGFAVTSMFVSHAYLPSFYYLVAFSSATMVLTRDQLRRSSPPHLRPRRG
jgi:O-antigen ligase